MPPPILDGSGKAQVLERRRWFSPRFAIPSRTIRCPQCQRALVVARKAISVRCPHCTCPMSLEDSIFTGLASTSVATLGRIRVTRQGVVQGRISCSDLTLEGQLSARVHAFGCMHIRNGGCYNGDANVDTLRVDRGGTYNGYLILGKRLPQDHAA